MEFSDYSYEANQINAQNCQIVVIKKDNTRFGANICSRGGRPPDEFIFNLFKANNKQFHIDVETIKESEQITVNQDIPETLLTKQENHISI